MKRLLLGIAIASLVGSIAQAQPVAEDIDVYTDTSSINGDLAPLVEGGQKPYAFMYSGETPVNGVLMVNPNGTFTFILNQAATNGSFRYHVLDANQAVSNDATVTIERTSKEKLD